MSRFLGYTLSLILLYSQIANAEYDAPGFSLAFCDQPTIRAQNNSSFPSLRVELAFGLSSMVVDPDLQQGIGGGLYLGFNLNRWLGIEASIFGSYNQYKGDLGSAGPGFSGFNITIGPSFLLTPPKYPLFFSIDLGAGAYYILPFIQESVWEVGFSAGLTLGFRFNQHFGVGIKPRYHIHNIKTLAGPELFDPKSFKQIGVVDRLEVPFYVAFYFL